VTKAIDIETLRDAAPAPTVFCCDSGDAPLPCRPTSRLDGKYNRDNVVVPPITTPILNRTRIAPFAVDARTLRAWMRGADLSAPRWKPAAIYWPDRPTWVRLPPEKERFKVSATSVERAKARAAAVSPRPRDTRWLGADYRRVAALIREIGQNWTAPATVEWAEPEVGEGYPDAHSRKYWREWQAERCRLLYFRRRIYTDEETRLTAPTEAALLQEVALRALRTGFDDADTNAEAGMASTWNHTTTPFGTDNDPWDHVFNVPTVTHPTEITAALDAMLKTADRLTARRAWPSASEAGRVMKLGSTSSAQSRIGRAFAAAVLVAASYPLRGGRSRWQRREVQAAELVIGLRWHLLGTGPRTWSTDFAAVLKWGGVSARRIGEVFGYSRDTALRRAEADEVKLERLFGRFLPPEPPVRQPADSGCIIEVYRPSRHESFARQFGAAARTALADEYRALAVIPLLHGFCSRCRLEPIASLAAQAWLRHAYLVIAAYVDAGGRILICAPGMAGPVRWGQSWYQDRRSDERVHEEGFSGSYFRKPGLSPDRVPDKADVAGMMLRAGMNAEGEVDHDAALDAAAWCGVPKAVDIDAPDPDDDPVDDPVDGLTIVDDDEPTFFTS
jgi:hypothetical protein